MSKTKKSFVDLSHARLPEQARVMEAIQARQECPFCPEHLEKYHKEPIVRVGTRWLLTMNQWPYANTRVHLLAIHRRHTETLSDLTPMDWTDLGKLMTWAERHYKVAGGGIAMRFGDPAHNRGTVRHLHAQLLTAEIIDKNNQDYAPVLLYLG